MPRYEGTGGVFIRLSTDDNDKRVYLLTCAHVARPPPEFENVAYTRKYTSQPLEKFVLHGTDSYANALGDITKFILPDLSFPPPFAFPRHPPSPSLSDPSVSFFPYISLFVLAVVLFGYRSRCLVRPSKFASLA